MEIFKTIEMTKEERNVLDKILDDFNKSSISKKYCVGEAIDKIMNSDKNYLEDFEINNDSRITIKKALNWYWLILDTSLGNSVVEFINNLMFNKFKTYEVKIIM